MLRTITEPPPCFCRIIPKPPGPPSSHCPLTFRMVACEDLQVGFLSCDLGPGSPWVQETRPAWHSETTLSIFGLDDLSVEV